MVDFTISEGLSIVYGVVVGTCLVAFVSFIIVFILDAVFRALRRMF
jgi:tetrahydromethanopterin S-methyltransferase subunit B